MWILVAVAIESMALVGALSVVATRRTQMAFLSGFNTMALVTGLFVYSGDGSPRAGVVVAMVAVYLLRVNWMLVVWFDQTAVSKLDREMPRLQKILLPVGLANTVGWGYCLPLFFALRNDSPVGPGDGLGLTIYLLGTIFHFGGDYQKWRFKRRAGTQGRLLETGFWAMSRHPNYFGDFLIYVSFAVVGGNVWGWISPLINLLQYAFDAIPKNEKWAAQRYGPAWDAYKGRTKAFVPYLI